MYYRQYLTQAVNRRCKRTAWLHWISSVTGVPGWPKHARLLPWLPSALQSYLFRQSCSQFQLLTTLKALSSSNPELYWSKNGFDACWFGSMGFDVEGLKNVESNTLCRFCDHCERLRNRFSGQSDAWNSLPKAWSFSFLARPGQDLVQRPCNLAPSAQCSILYPSHQDCTTAA